MTHSAIPSLFRTLPLVLAFVFAACAGSEPVVDEALPTPVSVRALVEARNATVRSFTAYGRISIDTPEMSNSANIDITALKPDSLKLEITGPFGIGAMKGLITSARFSLYNGLENTLVEGASTRRNLTNILQISYEFPDMLALLTGTPGFRTATSDMTVQGTLSDGVYHLVMVGTTEILDYFVNLKYRAITRMVRRNVRGEVEEEVTFRDFRKKGDIYVAYMVSMERPLRQESFGVVLESISINPDDLDFSFKVPASAKKIAL